MSQIFRTATSQAIREIIEESGVEGRFGLILTEDSLEKITHRVVDLFEMTLELRAKTQEMFGNLNVGQKAKPTNSSMHEARKRNTFFDEESPFPKTKNAAELLDYGSKQNIGIDSIPTVPAHNLKLPRKRYELSLEERERMSRK
ncbi:hypothetical protein [Fluviispira multicolorata]|uniref:Uncharacterized protein n=1 Tax=Fluviispira multicolorata TaxID=2654512 RepID=A0A833N3C0_9BACT|nr:hypothetical protein [Fluviispira multicolorata]KAB8033713.1 hypothetical protein GCL57_03125 [Fluviispira multicolorata]